MVRQARAKQYEHLPAAAIAVGNEYPSGHLHPLHRHRRAQLLHSASGTMIVSTEHGSWSVPPQQGVWIPPGVMHGIRMIGQVATNSVYIEPDSAILLPARCCVIGVPPLLRQLLSAAVDLPPDYATGSRADMIMQLLLHEIQETSVPPLAVPMPRDARLAERCRRFLEQPDAGRTIDHWSVVMGMSRRAFTRQFRAETGLSLAAWQRLACLMTAVSRLAAGEPVTTIALDLGYTSPAAFTAMFKRVLGVPPSRYATALPRVPGPPGSDLRS